MSRIYINGFDHESKIYLNSVSSNINITSGIHGKCLNLSAENSYLGYNSPLAATSSLSVGMNYVPADAVFNFSIHPKNEYYSTPNEAYARIVGTSNSISISVFNRVHNGVEYIYYTATPAAQRNLQILFSKSASIMTITVKLDDTQMVTSSSLSCLNSDLLNGFRIYNRNSATLDDLFIDDLIVDNGSSWIGMKQVQTLEPNAEGDTMEFSASAGNTYDCVDNPYYSGSDYIYGNTFNDLCLFELENITGSPASISSLSMLFANKQMEGPPPTMYLQDVLKSGTSIQNGSSIEAGTVGTDFEGFFKVWETSPFTSSAWTESEINGLQVGIQLKSS